MHGTLLCLTLSAAMAMPAYVDPPANQSLTRDRSVRASSSGGIHSPPELAVDGESATKWTAAEGTQSGWLMVDLGGPVEIDRMILSGADGERRIDRFCLQVETAEGWEAVKWGGFIGDGREFRFDPVTTRRVRLVICEASAPPSIREFDVFRAASD